MINNCKSIMSSKNTFQEYCQRNKLPIPIYDTKQIQQIPILFESIVNFNGVDYSARGSSKVIAEKEAAALVCRQIHNDPNISTDIEQLKLTQKYSNIMTIPIEKFQKIYLIDGDNYHITNESVFQRIDSLYIYIVAKNNTKPQPTLQQQKYNNCCIFISESVSRDAVDHLITFNLGKMSVIWENKEYYIVTRDHFGECLEKFMPSCHFICSIDT